MPTMTELQQKQIEQAEELLFSGPQKAGFAKELFFGKFRTESIVPYPVLPEAERQIGDQAVAEIIEFFEQHVDPAKIDQEEDIPQSVIDGLAKLGVLGMAVGAEYGGRGFSQQNYCRVMEEIGARCGSTAVFVNAHHSIGLRALELFGTEDQKTKWMKLVATGEKLAAFALTEPEAGSDASNVQTRAEPAPDGSGYVLNGQKRYITNGGIAGLLTVMARTPDESEPEGKITAFLVTPDMQGFEVVEARMPKCGIRGTATARLAFHDMFVPKENLLGELGKGLKLALTVLDFGRTTFGASCTGAAKFCVQQMIKRANSRSQFGQTLGQFELVKEKIALAAAETYAMESATYHTAALIDSGAEDYMLETAMLKVFASDSLWRIVNDCLQIWGGAGFFTDQPFERMMRDARLNLIGEGANDVLRCFIAMYGLRNVGKHLESLLKKPWKVWTLWHSKPAMPASNPQELNQAGKQLAKQIALFASVCQKALIKHREGILNRQFVQARLGDAATELFMASCVFSRLASTAQPPSPQESVAGMYYLKLAHQRNQDRIQSLKKNQDAETIQTADTWLMQD